MRRLLLPLLLAGCAGESALESSTAPLRPDSPNSRETFRFDANDNVETFDSASGAFRVHFTRSGRHAVPGDALIGPPAFVQMVGDRYDDVLGFYRDELGFRGPLSDEQVQGDNGGDARFDVYLVDFDGVGDGHYSREACLNDSPHQCTGYMAQENDFAGYHYPSLDVAVRILASHEFFHAIQAAYDAEQGSVLSEGTAVWATEKYDPTLNDFEGFISDYLENTDRPLDEGFNGPVDGYSYGSALVFQFLDERYGTEIMPALWEACVNGAEGEANPQWLTALDGLLQRAYDTDMSEALVELASWNLFTRDYADPELSYARGRFYPEVGMDRESLPYTDNRTRLYRSSTNYWRFLAGQREQVAAVLVGDDDDLLGLRLFVSSRQDGTQSVPVEVDPTSAELVDVTAGAVVVVHVVNTNLEGDSRRPGICVGTAEEVAACLLELGAEPVEPEVDQGVEDPDMAGTDPDAGLLDDASLSDAGLSDAGASAEVDGDDGGCTATPGPAPWALLLGLLPLVRRRRRR
jgi:uncharacterized protein (TIGR03382 family)